MDRRHLAQSAYTLGTTTGTGPMRFHEIGEFGPATASVDAANIPGFTGGISVAMGADVPVVVVDVRDSPNI